MLLWKGTLRTRQNFARVRKVMIRKVDETKILAIKLWPWMACLIMAQIFETCNEYLPMGFWVIISQSLTVFCDFLDNWSSYSLK